jgi:hypothetical protein
MTPSQRLLARGPSASLIRDVSASMVPALIGLDGVSAAPGYGVSSGL